MDTTESCKICGCTQTNLIDGFYYCAECGTQDTNVRETVVEYTFLGDGTTAHGSRRRITKIPQTNKVQMTEDWYKWHCLNFLLKGLADEIIELGAAPSFKTKLLWVWTRYMKKYQNKADFGLAENEKSDDEEQHSSMNESDSSSDEEEENNKNKKNLRELSKDISRISMPLVISFLYVALNLDKSHIQLSHLLRFMKEERISIMSWKNLVPKELRPKRLIRVLKIEPKAFKYSAWYVRVLSLNVFRYLDLGNPIVPDLRPLVDEYMQELCLPNDLKPLVLSLIHYRSFDYLDINVQYKSLIYFPSYELHVMSHILMALKICFSLDCEYELKVSDAVDKINELEEHPKSYNAEPTERLFSFRDWCSYIQFRKTLLRTHSLYLGAINYTDMNDYVASEHQKDKRDYKITLNDEIAMDILRKMPSVEPNVIPRNEFAATMTPHRDYTRVIAEHLQDPNVKQLLSEDFTQYSLKYILEDMFLVDPESPSPKNIITGSCEGNIRETGELFEIACITNYFRKEQVYVKDCDNHNWTITQRPQLEHVCSTENNNDSSEKENDNGYESDSEIMENVRKASAINYDETLNSVRGAKDSSVISVDCNNTARYDLSSVTDIEMEIVKEEKSDEVETNQVLKIKEEDENQCIFDDNFLDLEPKKEDENEPVTIDNETHAEISEMFNIIPEKLFNAYNAQTQEYFTGDKDSDVSSVDSIRINPETLNRHEAIKELVLHACSKYKISIPGKYIQRTRKSSQQKKKTCPKINRPCFKGETTQKINGLISAYHSHIQNDILYQMSNMVQSAIAKFNQNEEPPEVPMEVDDFPQDVEINNDTNDRIVNGELNNTTHEPEENAPVAEDDQCSLFSENSDGETHAEDLLPKKNPDFDEATHDIRQLYIKPAENPGVPEIELNPKLTNIVEQQIEALKNDPTLLEFSPKLKDETDSEEDISLALFQEQKQLRQQLTRQEEQRKNNRLEHLIESEIPIYKYWIRHYNNATKRHLMYQTFVKDMDEVLPKSLVFTLKECADVVGYSPYTVHKGLQNVEAFLKNKFVDRTPLLSSSFAKHNKSKARKDF